MLFLLVEYFGEKVRALKVRNVLSHILKNHSFLNVMFLIGREWKNTPTVTIRSGPFLLAGFSSYLIISLQALYKGLFHASLPGQC